MNRDRRKQLTEIEARLNAAADTLSEIQTDLDTLKDEEQEAFDNLPEGLQSGDRGQAMEACIEAMTEIVYVLDEFAENVGNADFAAARGE